jgi:hypothetical protein
MYHFDIFVVRVFADVLPPFLCIFLNYITVGGAELSLVYRSDYGFCGETGGNRSRTSFIPLYFLYYRSRGHKLARCHTSANEFCGNSGRTSQYMIDIFL